MVNLALYLILAWLCLNLSLNRFTAIPTAKPGCPNSCGNVVIPYPFGIGLEGAYSLSDLYNVNCDTSFSPPKPFLGRSRIEIRDVSIITGKMRIGNILATTCPQTDRIVPSSFLTNIVPTNLSPFPIVFSDIDNKFFAIGCDDTALIQGWLGRSFTSGCFTECSKPDEVLNGSCSGIGCCQTSIPKGVKMIETGVLSRSNHTNVSYFNPCGHAFLAEQDKFTFNLANLSDPHFGSRIKGEVPVVLDWFVGVNQTCRQAQRNPSTYACKQFSNCTDFQNGLGYNCNCLPGYEGNPYHSHGCTDIDECTSVIKPCSHICTNTPGSYICTCPIGYRGDGLQNGTRCTINHSQFAMKFNLGMSFGLLFMLILVSWIYFTTKRKKLIQMKEKFFAQNGGLLLKQKLSKKGRTMESSTIFSAVELEVATNNYDEDRILGRGGYGTVYKGVLNDGTEVAIKKSKVSDKSQVEQFINEVIILTQINHRNVVKLLGCCLEIEVPILVYEFISNGTLYEHIHRNRGITSWLTWNNCIKLATEVAETLAHLHAGVAIPIIHRDVKSSNILLDESYTAKISDFGASRLVPIDHAQVTTLVQGTLGYLDPEYFYTGQLTEKSDVYSFGVVLAEILTKEKVISFERQIEERSMATYFLLAIKENRLMEILDPQLVREASEEQIVIIAELVKKCINVLGEERPTMKEVARELEGVKMQKMQPSLEKKNEVPTKFLDQHDLYNIPSCIVEHSRQYSMEKSLIEEMCHPY